MKFKAKTKGLDKYEEKMSQVPKQIRPVIAATLNKQAMDTKFEHMPAALDAAFTIRNHKFMTRHLRFTKAKKSADPSAMFSEVGSIGDKNFTGWQEQQEGKVPDKKRTATVDVARGGSFDKKQRPTTRMKKGTFRRQSQYKGRTKKHRFFNMMRETQKNKLNFIVSRGLGNIFNLPAGLYGWKGKNLKMLQSFKRPKVRKEDWRGDAQKRLAKKTGGFERIFEKRLNRLFGEF